jgi:hypothetical protein
MIDFLDTRANSTDWTQLSRILPVDGDRVQSLKCHFNENLDNGKIYISLLIHIWPEDGKRPSFQNALFCAEYLETDNIQTPSNPYSRWKIEWVSVNISENMISTEQVETATSVIMMFMWMCPAASAWLHIRQASCPALSLWCYDTLLATRYCFSCRHACKLRQSQPVFSPLACFRPFWIGKLSDRCLPIWTLLYVSFRHILISLTSFKGTPNSIRISYNTYLLTES